MGIRNNFLKYSVEFQWRKNHPKIARPDNIQKHFEFQAIEEDDYKLCDKLSEDLFRSLKKINM